MSVCCPNNFDAFRHLKRPNRPKRARMAPKTWFKKNRFALFCQNTPQKMLPQNFYFVTHCCPFNFEVFRHLKRPNRSTERQMAKCQNAPKTPKTPKTFRKKQKSCAKGGSRGDPTQAAWSAALGGTRPWLRKAWQKGGPDPGADRTLGPSPGPGP